MEKRYQIFISSTFSDLEDERKKIMEAILALNCFPAGMEMFPATDMEQFEYIKSVIDQSDYYVVVIAGRYGSLAEDGISYTEKEFDYALEKGIPVLAFLKQNLEDIPAKNLDNNKFQRKKLMRFREKVKQGRMVRFWDNKDELKANIYISLKQAFQITPRTGWIKADTDNTVNDMDKCLKKKIKVDIYDSFNENWDREKIEISVIDIMRIIDSLPHNIDCSNEYMNCLNAHIREIYNISNKSPDVRYINKILLGMDLVNITYAGDGYNITLSRDGKKLLYKYMANELLD